MKTSSTSSIKLLAVLLLFNAYQSANAQLLNYRHRPSYEEVFTSLELAMATPDKVSILDLSGSNLDTIPKDVFKLKNLQVLHLGFVQGVGFVNSNNITELPPELFELSKLEELYLASNQFKSIPPEIRKLAQLQILDLSWNPFKKLPKEIGELKKLESLRLNGSQIKNLPDEIGELKALRTLMLIDNQLKSFPVTLTKLENLKHININGSKRLNLTKTLDLFSKLPKLNHLNLPNVKKIPENIVELKTLRTLYITDQNFKEFASPLETLSQMPNLRKLLIYDYSSDIINLPSEIGLITQLEELELLFYGKVALPPETAKLTKLKRFRHREYVHSGLNYLPKGCTIH